MGKIYCGDRSFYPDAILFDKDGTLADSQHFLQALGRHRAETVARSVPGIASQILKSFGFTGTSLDPAGLLAVGTRQENEIAIAALIAQTGATWMRSLQIAQQAFMAADQQLPRKADLTPPFPGIIELVRSLHCRGFKLGILSSDSTDNVEDFSQRYQLNQYFSIQMGAQPGLAKPDPRLLHFACAAIGISPQKTIVIGDSQADLQLARSGGAIAGIGVTWGGVTVSALAPADAIAHQVEDIQALE